MSYYAFLVLYPISIGSTANDANKSIVRQIQMKYFHFSFMFEVEKNKRITDVKKKRDPHMKVETMNMIQHFE